MATAGRTSKNHEVVKKIIKLKTENPNLSGSEIGQMVGRDRTVVNRALQRYGIKKKELKDYISNRGNLLAGTQDKILHSISTRDLENSSLRDLGLVYGILFDKERLEEGKSTQNVALSNVVEIVDRKERQK